MSGGRHRALGKASSGWSNEMATSTQQEHLAYIELKQLERLRSGIAMLIVACICCVACVMLTGISELSISASGAWDSVRHWVTGLCWCAFGIVWLMSLRRIAWGGLYANRNILTSNMQFLTGLVGLVIVVHMFVFVLDRVSSLFDDDHGPSVGSASPVLDVGIIYVASFFSHDVLCQCPDSHWTAGGVASSGLDISVGDDWASSRYDCLLALTEVLCC